MPPPRAVTVPASALRVAGVALHVVAMVCVALMLWRLLAPVPVQPVLARVSAAGALDASLASLVMAPNDSLDIVLDAVPSPVTRATVRALRGSGRTVVVRAERRMPAVAVSLEEEWRASGGTRVAVASGAANAGVVQDGAGLIDSVSLDSAGQRMRSGPVQGALRLEAGGARAAAAPLVAGAPAAARVLIAGTATWESKFLTAALEEAGWPVDLAVSLSPSVTIGQGAARVPSRARHAIVVVLPGAASSVTGALPSFVRQGGGVVLVGEAARLPGVAALRAGAAGVLLPGEAGAEASDQPQHGLDLVPVTALVRGSVPLEFRDGRTAVAARRIGAGRVLQVGYDNSWLWRMAGGDDAPAAHRRWWSTLLSGLVPMSAPQATLQPDAEHDTLDAAPLAALVRDLGAPAAGARTVTGVQAASFAATLSLRWLLTIALTSFVASWVIRRWRGLA